MNWLEPWYACDEELLVGELKREICAGHPLWKKTVHVLWRRADCDDVLFGIDDGTARVAVVHLTFRSESDPRGPAAEIFQDLDEFWLKRMKSDHEERGE